MSDIQIYFSLQDKVDNLEKQVTKLKKRLHNEVSKKSYMKNKKKERKERRGEMALRLIKEFEQIGGEPMRSISIIAERCFLTPVYVKRLWYKGAC